MKKTLINRFTFAYASLLLAAVLFGCNEQDTIDKQQELQLKNDRLNIRYGMELYKNKVLKYCVNNKIPIDIEKIDNEFWSSCENCR